MAIYLHGLVLEAEIVAFHYRGYRPGTRRTSAAALLEDAPLLYDCMIKPILPAKVVVVGFSIGSGVAAHLARERSVDGVILVTPFDTLEQLARQHLAGSRSSSFCGITCRRLRICARRQRLLC